MSYRTLSLVIIASLLISCSPKKTSPEKLLALPPNGWKLIYQINNVGTRLTDFIPEEDDEINWTSKVSFESFQDFSDADPIDVTLGEVKKDEEVCNFVQHFNLFAGLENNYPTSLRLYMCGKNKVTEKGEVKIIKAIKGDDYFYIVRLVKRLDAFGVHQARMEKSEIAAWSSYLKKMRVCNDESVDHPCPQPGEDQN